MSKAYIETTAENVAAIEGQHAAHIHSPEQSNLVKLASVLLSFSSQDENSRASPTLSSGFVRQELEERCTSAPPPIVDTQMVDFKRAAPSPTAPLRAYAKLQGRDWEYYVQKLSLVLGRGMEDGSGDGGVDVCLGSNETMARKHLRIEYNIHDRVWELFCLGRNGVRVNGQHYEPFCQPVPLTSKSLVKCGDVDFYFLLPLESSARPSRQSGESRKRALGVPRTRKPEDGTKGSDEDPVSVSDSEVAVRDLNKPPMSYACLIAEAINSTEGKKLTLSGIYKYLSDKYAYFRYTKSGWQNSIRHNLSLNKAFRKVPRSLGEPGKGMFWVIDPAYKHLVEAAGSGRRNATRGKSLNASTTSVFNINSAPATVNLAMTGGLKGASPNSGPSATSYIPILPTRPVTAPQSVLAPQLLEAAAALDGELQQGRPIINQGTHHSQQQKLTSKVVMTNGATASFFPPHLSPSSASETARSPSFPL